MRNATLAVLLALLTLAAPAAAATNPPSTPAGPARTGKPATPVGIITFNATLVGVGATFTWGRGWLTYKGQNYPIRLDGLGIIGLGVSKIQATGKVYHLPNAPRTWPAAMPRSGPGLPSCRGPRASWRGAARAWSLS